jgi:hypothetical protein
MALADFNQWSTAKPLISGAGGGYIADESEALRVATYQLYEQMYWGVDGTFKLLSRGAENKPIYVPSPKIIVETLHRYLARNMTIAPDPARGDTTQQTLLKQVWDDLAVRERFYSRFISNKRYGIIRGQWLWHFYADPAKPAGSRLSIMPIDPASWFPIYSDTNPDDIIGCHIVEPFKTNEGKDVIKRLTYRKATGMSGPSPITSEAAFYKVDDWGGPGMDQEPVPEEILFPVQTLPSPIDQLPVYSMPNFEEPGSIYGSSELRGFERILAGIDQSISDEELALAMDGLGVYATNAGAPIDADSGVELPWDLGPAKVVEVPTDSFFNRVSGVTSVAPYLEHVAYLDAKVNEASGSPQVARGVVDVSVAESGIALEIQFDPLVARVEERQLTIDDKLRQMFYDLPKWLVAYEGSLFSSLLPNPEDPTIGPRLVPTFGDIIPPNKAKQITDNVALEAAGIISAVTARENLRAIGVPIPEEAEEAGRIEAQKAAAADAFGARIDGELAAADTGLDDEGAE